MEKIYVESHEVNHKYFYMILGVFTYVCTISWAIVVWDDIFFGRSRWLTRKNLLEYLQKNRSVKFRKSYSGFIYELEDGSEIFFQKNEYYSYHLDNKCVLVGNSYYNLSNKVIDKKIIKILNNLVRKPNEKSI